MEFLDKTPPQFNYYLALSYLELASCLLLEDKDCILTKNQVKNLTRDINQTQRALKNIRRTSTNLLKLQADKMHMWQIKITANQLELSQGEADVKYNYGTLSFYYLLDAYYHILMRLLTSLEVRELKCYWCKHNLAAPWRRVCKELISEKVPNCFIYYELFKNPEAASIDSAINQIKAITTEMFSIF